MNMTLLFTAVNSLAALTVALFTWRVWRSTETYARATAMQVLTENLRISSESGGSTQQCARKICVTIFKRYPDIYEVLQDSLPDAIRQELRKT